MARPDFSNVWGSTNAPFTAITDTDYKAGWVFRTGAPPRRVNFDYFQNLSDLRHEWLGQQMLQAVGHDWQSDVSYNLQAYTRSTVNGKLYKSLDAVNLGNEPSATPLKWREVPDLSQLAPATGVQGLSHNLKASSTGLNAVVSVTASSILALNSLGQTQRLTGVSVSPSLAASGVNGLDTGTSAANSWYYVYVIWNGVTTAGLLSLSDTSPALPSGYTHFALVSAVRSDGTGNKYPLPFTQDGREIYYNPTSGTALPNDFAAVVNLGTATSITAVSLQGYCPPIASAGILGVNASGSTSTQASVYKGAAGAASGILAQAINNGVANMRARFESPRPFANGVFYLVSNPGSATILVLGWRF